MLRSDTNCPSGTPKHPLLPAVYFSLSGVLPIIMVAILPKHPKEVTAAVFSIYIALMSITAAIIFKKKAKRGAMFVSFVICALFTSVFVTYAYIAYKL